MLAQTEFESLVAKAKQDATIEETAQEVRAKYGPMFTPHGIATLDPGAFTAFFGARENRHYHGLTQGITKLTADLPSLKEALLVLIDDSKPISARIDQAREMVVGLGKARVSLVLLVALRGKYGVYNNKSVAALKQIGEYPGDKVPDFDAMSLGEQYEQVNRVLNELSAKYGISLWALDAVLGHLGTSEGPELPSPVPERPAHGEELPSSGAPGGRFPLEKYLQGFLVDDWDQTPLSASLEILADEDGEIIGDQYQTEGLQKIDILCKNKDGSGFTVVELKRDQTSDQTVVQLARYMGWVKKHLAKEGESVRGLIICGDADERLMTTLTVVPNVEVFTYDVRFTLSKKE